MHKHRRLYIIVKIYFIHITYTYKKSNQNKLNNLCNLGSMHKHSNLESVFNIIPKNEKFLKFNLF